MTTFHKITPEDLSQVQAMIRSSFAAADSEEEGDAVAALVERLGTSIVNGGASGHLARESGAIVGAIFFTPLLFDNAVNVMLLSPVAVATAAQGEGIGQALITHGLSALAEAGVDAVVTYGDPAFYGRLGFQSIATDTLQPPYALSQPEGWQVLALAGKPMPRFEGVARCVAAFEDSSLW